MTAESCNCRACVQAGSPFPGISLHPEMHVTAADLPLPKRAPERARFATDDEIAQAIGIVIAEVHRETDAKIAALNAKIARLETAMEQFKFKSAWVEGDQYRAGNFCSHGGAIFHCCADTKSKPGNDDKSWLLVVPRARDGRDGKDGKDFTPLELSAQRTVKSARK
jgi:hypothetical protein